VFDGRKLPERTDKSDVIWKTRTVPIAPFTAFQLRIVGLAECSGTVFDANADFTVTLKHDGTDQPLLTNLLNSEDTYDEKLAALNIGGVQISPMLLTGEYSNLSCNITKSIPPLTADTSYKMKV
jgi:hypothetical protein